MIQEVFKMIQLFNEDAIKCLRSLKDNSVDVIFTDPPYMTTANEWDKNFDIANFFEEAWRVLKEHGCVLLWAQAPFSYKVVAEEMKTFRYEWIIEKTAATGHLNAKKMPMKAHENVLVFYKKLPTYNPQMTHGHERKVSTAAHKRNSKATTNYGSYALTSYDSTDRYPRDVITFKWDKQKSALHPTQKPIAACEYFIKTYTNPGDIVVDPYMGSGSIGVAALNLNRKYIGCELSGDYFKIANERLNSILLSKKEAIA